MRRASLPYGWRTRVRHMRMSRAQRSSRRRRLTSATGLAGRPCARPLPPAGAPLLPFLEVALRLLAGDREKPGQRTPPGPTRAKNRAAVCAAITEWTSQRTKREVMEIIAGAGVPCGALPNSRPMPPLLKSIRQQP